MRAPATLMLAVFIAAACTPPVSVKADGVPPAPAAQAETTYVIASLVGTYSISGVAVPGGGVQAFLADDPAIIGSRMQVSATRLSWLSAASASFTSSDVCADPVPMPIQSDIAGAAQAARFASAFAQFGVSAAEASPLHEWVCLGDGRWGPADDGGAFFYGFPDGRLVMEWYDNVMLELTPTQN
jgi:hypothetical protein